MIFFFKAVNAALPSPLLIKAIANPTVGTF